MPGIASLLKRGLGAADDFKPAPKGGAGAGHLDTPARKAFGEQVDSLYQSAPKGGSGIGGAMTPHEASIAFQQGLIDESQLYAAQMLDTAMKGAAQ